MGQAIVKSHLGDALYSVEVQFDNAAVEARQTFIETRLIEIDEQVTTLDGELTIKAGEIAIAIASLNEYIATTLPEEIFSDPSIIKQLTNRGFELRAEYDSLKRRQNLLKLEKISLSKESDCLSKYCPSSIKTHAWCVEYNEELTGSTKSIEVDYALIRDPLTDQIRTEGVWLPGQIAEPTDILRHPMAGSVHSTWFDIAMAPAAQRHKGRYRVATIDALNTENDTADITFEGRYSPQESLKQILDTAAIHPMIDGGQQRSVKSCPVVYMTCDAAAFAVGDKVVVDLHQGAGLPTVIGFYEKPRQCAMVHLIAKTTLPKITPMAYMVSGQKYIELKGWHSKPDLYTNRENYTVAFNHGPQNAVFVSDTVQWADGDSYLNMGELSDPIPGYYESYMGLPNDKPWYIFELGLLGGGHVEIFKNGILVTTLSVSTLSVSVDSPSHVDIVQSGPLFFAEHKNSPAKGFFTITQS